MPTFWVNHVGRRLLLCGCRGQTVLFSCSMPAWIPSDSVSYQECYCEGRKAASAGLGVAPDLPGGSDPAAEEPRVPPVMAAGTKQLLFGS